MIHAAGILFLTEAGEALFVKRADEGDHVGEWALPGGKIEDGETPELAAQRECVEELGECPEGERAVLTRRIADGVDYTTFLQKLPKPFDPKLNDEHSDFVWADPSGPPEPAHSGVRIALTRLSANELDIARMMAAGDLVSPQRYGKFWLFDIRLTGTGAAYRNAVKDDKGKVLREAEYCWRDPAIYLDPEFLARANGLPVIYDHPEKKPALDSEEFHNRIVGTTFLPYIKGDEVWAIVKIWDDSALDWLHSGRASTSPAVVFSSASNNEKVRLSDGTVLLVEGDPALLDHIALCGPGVWDKGGEPSGVVNQSLQEGPIGMTEEERIAAADKARKDSEDKLDRIADALKRMDSRLDSFEAVDKARKDAEEASAKEREEAEKKNKTRFDAARKDKFGARKDGEKHDAWKARHDADEMAMTDAMRRDGAEKGEAADQAKAARDAAEKSERKDGGESFEKWAKEEATEPEHEAQDKARRDAEEFKEKARMDAVRHDSATNDRISVLEARLKSLTTEVPADERNALALAQSRADTVAAMFGDRASAPIPGERPVDYRKRLLGRFQKHSDRFKGSRLDSLDEAMLGPIEDIVYADAVQAAKSPDVGSAPGLLIPITTREGGRDVTRFNGDILGFMAPFMTGATVGRINRNPNGGN